MSNPLSRRFLLALALSAGLGSLAPAQAQSSPNVFLYRVPMGLQGAEAPTGGLVLSNASVSFADLLVGDSAAGAVLLENTGTGPVSLDAISYAGPADFVTDASSCPASLAAGQNCAIGVSFAPLSRGNHSGALNITYQSNRNAQVSLHGRGLQGQLQASPGALDFGAIVLPGAAAPAQAFTLSNIGDGSVSAIGATAAAPYVLSGSCPALAAGQTCNLTVDFAPASAGNFPGAVQITSPVGDLTVSLAGQAAAAQAVAVVTSAPLVDFGTVLRAAAAVDRVVSVRNDGNGPLSVTGASGLPGIVSVQSNTCTAVAPGATCSLGLRMETVQLSLFTNQAALLGGVPNSAGFSVSGAVTAADAAVVGSNALTFGSVIQGGTAVSRVLTLRNDGNIPMTLSGLSNLPTSVALASNSCTAIASGATCDLTLTLSTGAVTSFTNQSVQTQGATTNATALLSGAVAAATQVATITSGNPVAFGTVSLNSAAVTRVVNVRNDGGSAMTLTGLSGLPTGVTLQANTCSGSIAPAASCALTLRMATTSAISVNTSVTTIGASSNATIAISGVVLGAGQISASQIGNSGWKDAYNTYGCGEEACGFGGVTNTPYTTAIDLVNNTGAALTVTQVQSCNMKTFGASYPNRVIVPVITFNASNGFVGSSETSNDCTMRNPIRTISWPAGSRLLIGGSPYDWASHQATAGITVAQASTFRLRLSNGQTIVATRPAGQTNVRSGASYSGYIDPYYAQQYGEPLLIENRAISITVE